MIHIHYHGLTDYQTMLDRQIAFSEQRALNPKEDQIWLLEHYPVYTLGLKQRHETEKSINGIPLIQANRGGETTYHGPGQWVLYLLLDLSKHSYGVGGLVDRLEKLICNYLFEHFAIKAIGDCNARGVYVEGKKIASIGLRASKGKFCYHGVALNVDMDLKPFEAIDPCGLKGMQMTQIVDWITDKPDWMIMKQKLIASTLSYLEMTTDYEEFYHG